jgi:coenzyme F420-reducing hydrogenase delta subunit
VLVVVGAVVVGAAVVDEAWVVVAVVVGADGVVMVVVSLGEVLNITTWLEV